MEVQANSTREPLEEAVVAPCRFCLAVTAQKTRVHETLENVCRRPTGFLLKIALHDSKST